MAPSRLTRILIRLTPSQIKALDEYRSARGDIPRATACRELLYQQLRYVRWQEERRKRNLPPTPKIRLPQVRYEDVRESAVDLKRNHPDATVASLAFNIGRKIGLGPVNRRIAEFTRRALKEGEYEAQARAANHAVRRADWDPQDDPG
jgi:hypothetical protein